MTSQIEESTILSDSVAITHTLLCGILDSIESFDLSNLDADVSRFVEITTLIASLNKDELAFRSAVKEAHIQLLFIMKGLVAARENQDKFALEDLIKHELKDNLTQWKIDLIPQIKRIANR